MRHPRLHRLCLGALAVAVFLVSPVARGAPIGSGSISGPNGLAERINTDVKPAIDPASVPGEWRGSQFYLVETDLSPAVLICSQVNRLKLFSNLDQWGEGAPTHLAVPTKSGPNVLRAGVASPGSAQSEAWLLVWFSGAQGWTNWDSPWLVVLQHRPANVSLAADGLTLEFDTPCEHVALMPLYGYFKPPPHAGADFLVADGLPSRGVQTWTWSDGLPQEVVERCRWWTSALREFPLGADETFSIDPRSDTLSIRQRFQWLSIEDDWKTPHIKFGPISPALGLAWLGETFPMKPREPLHDPDLFTPFGPLVGTVGVDEQTIDFPGILKYVNEARQLDLQPEDPIARKAVGLIRETMRGKFRRDDWTQIWDHGGPQNYCWQIAGDHWYAKALPFCDDVTRGFAARSLRGYYADYVLKEERYMPRRGMLLLRGPGIGVWSRDGFDDAGKFSTNLVKTLWNYVSTGGSDAAALARERWALIKRLFITPYESDWRSFGRYSIAEQGDEAGPAMGYARLAWAVGDADEYAYGCYIFVRELVHHYIKMKGAEYFRRRQPFESMEPMPPEVYLTNLWGTTAGWRIDGPTWPKQTGERQYNNRWVRLSEAEIGRFYQDVLAKETRAELDLLATRPRCPYKLDRDTAHIAPSLIRLRSILLAESPEALSQRLPIEKGRVGRGADRIAFHMSYALNAQPPAWSRIIDAGSEPTPFVVGLQRIKNDGSHCPVAVVSTRQGRGDQAQSVWPTLTWWGWPPPAGGDSRGAGPAGQWSFGRIVPGDGKPPVRWRSFPLNWNTTVVVPASGN